MTFTSGFGWNGCWNQGDENSFTFYYNGDEFAIDPGAGLGSTFHHNAILVDGEGQDTDGGAAAVQGDIVAYEDFGDDNHGTAKVGEVSGTTLNFGVEAEFAPTSTATWEFVIPLSSSGFVVAYSDGANSNEGFNAGL